MDELLEYGIYLALLVALAIPLSGYINKVMAGEKTLLGRVLVPVEGVVYRMIGVEKRENMGWKRYLVCALAFSAVSLLVLWIILMAQGALPFNPEGLPGQTWDLAFNTAVSFVTNTNWQAYSGESSLSYFSQAIGLTVQNFVTPAVGMAVLFALFAMLASFGTGCGTQINAIAEVIETNLPIGIPRIAIGIVFGIVTAIIILGGIESIATVCEKLVPVMALFYVLGCIVILGINFDYILPAFRAIFTLAFRPGAVAGGLVGGGIRLALQYGVARGLFSNEAGMGSAPLVASAAQTRNPVRQALVSATGTFWTTVVVCLMTGLVLISTIMKNPAVDMASIANGGQMTTIAFAQIPYIGPAILVFSIITFAYSTILGWSYYGERAAEYLLGRKAILPYKLLFLAVVVFSPVLALDLMWSIADILNALMAIPNLIAVLLLSGVIASETRHYLNNLDEEDTTEIPVIDR